MTFTYQKVLNKLFDFRKIAVNRQRNKHEIFLSFFISSPFMYLMFDDGYLLADAATTPAGTTYADANSDTASDSSCIPPIDN